MTTAFHPGKRERAHVGENFDQMIKKWRSLVGHSRWAWLGKWSQPALEKETLRLLIHDDAQMLRPLVPILLEPPR